MMALEGARDDLRQNALCRGGIGGE